MIQSIFAPLAAGNPASFGLTDDAALFTLASGRESVLTSDMLVEGVHFLPDTNPSDIAWKSLAVNVSDLAAKGADPEIYLLSIALPRSSGREWLAGFASGFSEAQAAFGCRLAGGDTTSTPGRLTISITAVGTLPSGTMIHRSGARPDDLVYVTGTIGDGVAGLELLRGNVRSIDDEDAAWLVGRHRRPVPVAAMAKVVRDNASAAMDISDGLAGDFEKLCAASQCGGAVEAARVPLSGPARGLVECGALDLETLLCGGDDYCVLAAIPPEKSSKFEEGARKAGALPVCIGRIVSGGSVDIVGGDGQPMQLSRPGFDHFAS